MKLGNEVTCFLSSLLALVMLLGLQACGTAGYSSNNGGVSNPPSGPAFVDFKAPGAGQRVDGGTFPLAINSPGTIVGWYAQVSRHRAEQPFLFAGVSHTVFADQAGGNRLLVNIETAAVAMNLHGVLLRHCRRRQL